MKRLMSILLVMIIVVSSLTLSVGATDNQGIESFVTRLYSICLDREPDQAGFDDWCNKLSSNQITGSECAYGFIFSSEFQSKNVSNEQYVELMYNCFFGRASDPDGKAGWVDRMNGGMSRQELFAGFANSAEFDNLCQDYEIMRGSYNPNTGVFSLTANKKQLEEFVTRLYSTFLGRTPDQAGLADWVNRLASNSINGSEAAYGFIFSREYKEKNKSDRDFVTDLYVGFLGRTPDNAGLNDWVSQISTGKTDLDIFNGFAGSQEWIGLCRQYGIEAGGSVTGELYARMHSNTVASTPTQKPTATPTPTITSISEPSYIMNIEKFEIIKQKYDDEYEYEAIVSFTNTGNEDIYVTGASFDIEDASGKLLQSDSYPNHSPYVIKPGETGYLYNQFGTTLEGITDVEGIRFVPQFIVKTTNEPPHRYPVSDTSIRDGKWGIAVVGRITNDTDEDESYMYVRVMFFDSNNKILGISGTSVTNITAGRTVSFEVEGLDLPEDVTLDQVASFRVIAEDSFYAR